MSNASENLRRSSRIRAQTKPTIADEREDDTNVCTTLGAETDTEIHLIEEDKLKPTELFSNMDVSGKRLYGFYTPLKKNAMTDKANSCRTSVDLKTPTGLSVPKIVITRVEMSNNATTGCEKQISGMIISESESISEDSEYVPSENEEEEKSSKNLDTDSNEDENSDENRKIKFTKESLMPSAKLLSSSKNQQSRSKSGFTYKDCYIKTDDYFETQLQKAVTSDRTLERLRNSRLTKDKLEKLLANQSHVSEQHKNSIYALADNYTTLFPMWYFIMREGYTVLLYGLGSKRNLINHFHQSTIVDYPTLIVNGFFPSLTIKDILDGIIVDLLEVNSTTNVNHCLDLIRKIMKDNPKDRLYLLIHNIDGVMLQSGESQDVLSSLAAIPNIHILASVDHINAPLLWDHVKRSKFNFFWWDVATFLPYQEETSYEGSLLVQHSGALALSSLHNVFLSLTSNARSIYILLVKHQLSNNNNINYYGMAFKDLYRAAREEFLVSSDLALRAQLTEFVDHKLVKTKRNIDGIEYLTIPLDAGVLKQFLEEHDR
ncbi:hypothetical protein KM043_006209 [Ampulex compressa]|nr:hypothetical protein KM043_006209 [Ampulex compressa]